MACIFFFFNDTATTEIYTLSLHDALPILLTNSRCGSAPDFYTDQQRHQCFTARISLRLGPRFLYYQFLVAAAPPLFILTNSRCGSAPAIYTDHFSLRQRPRFLYCPFLVVAVPPLFILTNSRCGSGPAFYTDRQRHEFFTARISLRQRPAFYTAHLSLRQRPRFLYCQFLVAAAPPLFILTNSRCGSAPAIYTDHFSLRQRPRFILPFFRCGSAPAFYTDRQRHEFFTAPISLRQRDRKSVV